MSKMKKLLLPLVILAALFVTTACGNGAGGQGAATGGFSAGMVTDQSGVNDQSFNQSSWDGLQRLQASIGANVTYIESADEGEIARNMDTMLDLGKDIIWVIGFQGRDPVYYEAMRNPSQTYGIVDYNFSPANSIPPNVVAVAFWDNEAAFLAGYLAARTSESGVIGFIGGMDIPPIHRFEAGFHAGAAFANYTHDMDVEVLSQYIGDFHSAVIARGIADSMHAHGADVLYAAAGTAGQGAIDAAIAHDIYVIGVDLDQSHLAPNNMLTSTLKHVGAAIYDISLRYSRGESVGGQNLVYGIAQGAVGITEFEGVTAQLMDSQIHADTKALAARIGIGEMRIPSNEVELGAFLAGLS